MNVRVPLPAAFWLTNRPGAEVRDVDGDVSGRVKYQLGIEREVTVFFY